MPNRTVYKARQMAELGATSQSQHKDEALSYPQDLPQPSRQMDRPKFYGERET